MSGERLNPEALSDLYEALVHVVGCAHEAPRFGPFDQFDNTGQPYQSADFDTALKKARAALAKARGDT